MKEYLELLKTFFFINYYKFRPYNSYRWNPYLVLWITVKYPFIGQWHSPVYMFHRLCDVGMSGLESLTAAHEMLGANKIKSGVAT